MDDEVSEDTIDLLATEPERDVVDPDAMFEGSEEFLTILLKKRWQSLSSLEVAGAISNMGS